MTGVIVSGTLKTDRSTIFGGAGSIVVETRRNGTPEGLNRVVLFSRLGRLPVASDITDAATGQHTFANLSTVQIFSAIAYDLMGITQGTVQTDLIPSASPSITILDFAGQGAAGSNTVTVSLVLKDRDDVIQANLTGLKWVFFDSPEPDDFVSVVDKGSGASTDGSGNFQVTVNNSTLTDGGIGFIVISDTDGNPINQSIAHAHPAEVAIV